MKLARTSDKIFLLVASFLVAVALGSVFVQNFKMNTFAEDEDIPHEVAVEHFVTFYDNGQKLTVKTNAGTVGEALNRAGIMVESSDIVEPALSDEINSDNFFINIYRSRPAVVKDGKVAKYVMTASYDLKQIARNAGFTVYDGDEVRTVKNESFLEAGVASVYEIVRNGGRTITEEVEIPFGDIRVKDYNLTPGVEETRQLGEVGMKEITYNVQYVDSVEIERTFISERVVREPVDRIVAVGASEIEKHPLTARMGRNRYTVRKSSGEIVERMETYYDLPMSGVMAIAARECGVKNYYTVREDGVKVDADGYVLVAAHLSYYPRCSIVETSLGPGRVYDTGTFAETNPEQFDLATDWTNRDGR